jgi:hypothetical protein
VYIRYSNASEDAVLGYARVCREKFCVLIFDLNKEVSASQVGFLGLGNSLGGETVLVCTAVWYAILC